MARKYNRDKLGRFAPKGSGATARGGRLKTASGRRRATQTIEARTPERPGVIGIGRKPSAPASNVRATGRLKKPQTKNQISRTAGRFGPKNTINTGPKSPRTKANRLIKEIKNTNNDLGNKLKDTRKRADAFKQKMVKADKRRAQKAYDKPSVTDKRSRDFLGKLTKEGRMQDPKTGGKKRRKKDK